LEAEEQVPQNRFGHSDSWLRTGRETVFRRMPARGVCLIESREHEELPFMCGVIARLTVIRQTLLRSGKRVNKVRNKKSRHIRLDFLFVQAS
jgi:hypothetical protein